MVKTRHCERAPSCLVSSKLFLSLIGLIVLGTDIRLRIRAALPTNGRYVQLTLGKGLGLVEDRGFEPLTS